jgi:hypothetical protein
MSFTCPVCHRVSHHPEDRANLYCGACHQFFDRTCGCVCELWGHDPDRCELFATGTLLAHAGTALIRLPTCLGCATEMSKIHGPITDETLLARLGYRQIHE